MKVYCTRPFTHNQTEPHLTEVVAENLRDMDKKLLESVRCTTCEMPLILNGRYVPIEKIGQGGFGCTFLALDLSFGLDSKRAIKQFRSDHLLLPGEISLSKRAFEREYRIQDLLKHIQIPRVYEPFDVEAPPFVNMDQNIYYYFVQEYIEGADLQKKLKNRQQQSNSNFSEAEVLDILKQLLGVLDYIHSSSPPIIHRDIKPSNIIQDSSGTCYLIDFGAVKQVLTPSDPSKQTTIMGTPGYAPPEQFDGIVDFSSDLYALAKTCICLLTGFPASSSLQWGTSDLLTKILTKMISPDPQMRYRSALDAQHDLGKTTQVKVTTKSVSNPHGERNKWTGRKIVGIGMMLTVFAFIGYLQPIFHGKPIKEVKVPIGEFNYGCSTAWEPLIDVVKSRIRPSMPDFKLKSKTYTNNCKSSRDGFTLLKDNQLDIVLSSKKNLSLSNNNLEIKNIMVAKSISVMITRKDSKIEYVTEEQFNDIESGKIQSWKELTGESAQINIYVTDEKYTGNKNYKLVKDTLAGIKKVSADPHGIMIVPIHQVTKKCNIKVLSIKEKSGIILNPYKSRCLERSKFEIDLNAIKKMPDSMALDFEIVFKADKKEASEALAEIFKNTTIQDEMRSLGYIPHQTSIFENFLFIWDSTRKNL